MIKKFLIAGFLVFFVFFLLSKAFADDMPFETNPHIDTILNFYTVAPPTMIWVVDSMGNITGADSSQPFNRVGEQTQDWPNGLHGIPNSRAVQENIENDETGTAHPTTDWEINIKITTTQSYILNVKGIASGVGSVNINGLFPNDRNINPTKLNFLVNAGTLRQAQVDFKPGSKKIMVKRIVKAGDLLSDVKTACRLGNITSDRVCDGLEKRAKNIKEAFEDQNYKKTEEILLIFLHNLGDSRPNGCKDDDDHNFVKEPALTVLKEEAKALLVQVTKDNRGQNEDDDH